MWLYPCTSHWEEYLQTLVAAGRKRAEAADGTLDLWPDSTGRAGDKAVYDSGLPETPGDIQTCTKVLAAAGRELGMISEQATRWSKVAEHLLGASQHCLRQEKEWESLEAACREKIDRVTNLLPPMLHGDQAEGAEAAASAARDLAIDLDKVVELAGNRARSGKATEKHCLRELRDRRHRRRKKSVGAEGARGRSRSRHKDSSTSSEEEEGEESSEDKMEDAKVGDLSGNQPGQDPSAELSNTAAAVGAEGDTAAADGAVDKGGDNPMKEEPNVG